MNQFYSKFEREESCRVWNCVHKCSQAVSVNISELDNCILQKLDSYGSFVVQFLAHARGFILSDLQRPGPFCGPPSLPFKLCRGLFLMRKLAREPN